MVKSPSGTKVGLGTLGSSAAWADSGQVRVAMRNKAARRERVIIARYSQSCSEWGRAVDNVLAPGRSLQVRRNPPPAVGNPSLRDAIRRNRIAGTDILGPDDSPDLHLPQFVVQADFLAARDFQVVV